MANHDREREDPIFDGGEDDEDNEGSHLPVVIIIASLVLLAFGGVVWLAYNQGLARGRGDVPLRTASGRAVKAEDNGIKIFQQRAASNDEEEKAAAAPVEQPRVNAPQPQPAPVAVQANPAPTDVPPAPKQAAPVTAPAPQLAKPVLRPMTAPQSAPVPSQPQNATHAPAQLGGLNAPASNPAYAAPKTPVIRPEPAKPAPTKAAGSYLLQIGAFKSDAEARTAWKSYQSKHATLLNGFGPDVLRVDLGDKGTWYRLRIASFSDKDAASALCDRLKAQGGACFLAK